VFTATFKPKSSTVIMLPPFAAGEKVQVKCIGPGFNRASALQGVAISLANGDPLNREKTEIKEKLYAGLNWKDDGCHPLAVRWSAIMCEILINNNNNT